MNHTGAWQLARMDLEFPIKCAVLSNECVAMEDPCFARPDSKETFQLWSESRLNSCNRTGSRILKSRRFCCRATICRRLLQRRRSAGTLSHPGAETILM